MHLNFTSTNAINDSVITHQIEVEKEKQKKKIPTILLYEDVFFSEAYTLYFKTSITFASISSFKARYFT